MKKKILYILSSKIKWKTFKILQDKLVRDSGPTPVGVDKILWEMLREKKIMCWFAEDMKEDMGLGLVIPKRYKKLEWQVIKSP